MNQQDEIFADYLKFTSMLGYLNYLYIRGRCLQTPQRQRSTDPKHVCHFDPLDMEIDVSDRAFGLVVN